MLLPTVFILLTTLTSLKNITYNTIVTYITITNTTNTTFTLTTQLFFFFQQHFFIFFYNKCIYFNIYKNLARIASHLFLKLANVPRERLANEALGLVFHFLNSANLFLTSITFGSTRPIPNYILRQQTMKSNLSFILIFNDAERQLERFSIGCRK